MLWQTVLPCRLLPHVTGKLSGLLRGWLLASGLPRCDAVSTFPSCCSPFLGCRLPCMMSCWALWHGSIYYEALPTPFPPTGPGFGCEFCRHLAFGRLVVARTPCLSLLMRTCLCFPPPSPATSWDPSSWGAPHPGTGVLLELRRGAWLQADGNACYKKDTAHTATMEKKHDRPCTPHAEQLVSRTHDGEQKYRQ